MLSTSCFVNHNNSNQLNKKKSSGIESATNTSEFLLPEKIKNKKKELDAASSEIKPKETSQINNAELDKPKTKPTTTEPIQKNNTNAADQNDEEGSKIEEFQKKPEVVDAAEPAKELKPVIDESTNIIKDDILLDHSKFDQILSKYVSSAGQVDYKSIKNNVDELDGYLELLNSNPVENNWGRNEKMAYWINAYNAFTIKLIIDNYPLSSITKLHGGKPWDKKWISLGGKTYSLNQIENDILRPQFKDARIHFAVNCAAKSCPPLLNKAWTAANLNSNFDTQAKKFINDKTFNELSSDEIKVSKIFDWYKEDFGNLIDYLNTYSGTKITSNASIGFKEYDWNLNE